MNSDSSFDLKAQEVPLYLTTLSRSLDQRHRQAHVGSRGYPNNLYAFELTKKLPKFAMFSQVIIGSGLDTTE